MGLLRGIAGTLLWILSALLGLVAVILCAAIIPLPVGLPLLGYAGRLLTFSVKLMLPRAVSRPIDTTEKSLRKRSREARLDVSGVAHDAKRIRGRGHKQARRVRKKLRFVS